MSKFGSATFNSMHTVGDPKCDARRHASAHARKQITILIYSRIIYTEKFPKSCNRFEKIYEEIKGILIDINIFCFKI